MGNRSRCECMSAMILSFLEDTVLPPSSLASGSYNHSILSSITSLEGLLCLSPLEYFFLNLFQILVFYGVFH